MAVRVRGSYLPNKEDQFAAFVHNFVNQLTQHPDRYHIGTERVDRVTSLMNLWDTTVTDAVAARDAARAATLRKDQSRYSLEEVVRELSRIIQADPDVTDEDRELAGLPVRKTTRTPVPPPKTVPTGTVIGTERLQQTLTYSDASTPTRRARPDGVTGCEVWVAVAEVAPTNPADYRFVVLSTRTPEVVTFAPEEGGRTAHYLLRWVNGKGQQGPLSAPISATIPAI